MSGTPFCPATMCPLFAPDGSPYAQFMPERLTPNGGKNERCQKMSCAWFRSNQKCEGVEHAMELAVEHKAGNPLPLPECNRAHECQWQKQCGDTPCPPRYAYMTGRDPKICGG